jgi:type I restriction-modification system DNA methylase subunit
MPHELSELIERFDRNREAYLSGQYNETQLRREFLDPLFISLGWDIDNKQGYAEAYKDVIHEDAIKIGGVIKAPDYCFRIGGTKKFFVEAKKPSVNLKDDISPAFQLRRYAWSAKLPLSILTDFEELAVYDCRIKPVKTDKASTARILYLTYDEYALRWDEISSVFSRDAVLKGSFDKYAGKGKHKRGTAEVDNAFLEEIEIWRDMFARNIALRNQGLTQRELNFAVQRIIDRIIFLRICEDRGIEEYGRLMSLLNGVTVYKRLFHIFRNADERYNSGLFHFEKEKGRHELPDDLTPSLDIDDKLLKDIIRRLYYPESPYEFSVLPADILGQVYEQFLGKVIRLTSGHRAIVEEKPEVRKAGGVYYTPTYIVDYIVKNTVGHLVGAGLKPALTPKEVSKIRILDPACGSGSFLLGAYQYLIDWHRDWYVNNDPQKWATGKKPALYQAQGGDWHLTTAEKKRILLNNIYGVDIDSQAVEVTKLSLLLKVLEGENNQTLERQLKFFHERALPDLGDNIKCGNSLIAPDFYEQQTMLDDEERYRINVFDWNAEFPEIMKRGGFDAVIGNPPYGAIITDPETTHYQIKFEATDKSPDTYALFIEQAMRLCKPLGKISMIVPTGWYSGTKYSALRRFIASSSDPDHFVNLPYDIFKAWVDTTVFVLTKRTSQTSWPRQISCAVHLRTFPKRHKITTITEFDEDIRKANFTDWFSTGGDEYLTYADTKTTSLIQKIQELSKPLKEFADVQRGVTPFELTEQPEYSTSRVAFNGTVRRYSIEQGPPRYIRFDETLAEPKPERYFKGPRLLLRELINRQFRLQLVKVTDDFVTNKSMQSILQLSEFHDLNYLLGLLNSRLISWYFLNRSQIAQRDDFPKIVLKESRSLPIIPINCSNPTDKACYDKMISLVDQMLSLNKKLPAAKTDHEKTSLQRQIDATDRQIDQLIYELYGLTEEEIRIVEEAYS